MARVRLSDPGVKQRLQDRLAAGVSKEAIARELGISKVTLYAWISQLEEEMRAAVSTRKVDYAERLTQRQFSLYDELGRMATLLQNEVAQLGQAQRGLRTEQRSCISVPVTLVGYAIDVLAAMMVQHKAEKGCVPDADVWAALMRAARPVHSGLRDAYMTHDRHEGARRLVDQVAIFCRQSDTPQLLAAAREEGVEGFVVDALLALHEESMRRRKEHMRQHTP